MRRFLLLLLPVGLALASPACSESAPPSLVLITIDTLRADHLSAYGYRHQTSPVIDGLAERGVLFESVLSPLPETGPTCASLLTGMWPARLGIRGNGERLDERFETLPALLGEAGYRTAGFVSGYPLVRTVSGLDRGFDHYDDRMPDPRGQFARVQRLAEKTTDAAIAWLREERGAPFFIWVHYYDPHGDYAPGPTYEEMFPPESSGPELALERIPPYQRKGGRTDASYYVSLYDGEIRRVDDQVGRLLEAIEGGAGLDRTLIAVTADHGESLTEHGYFFDHGNELFLPSMHVPLILAGPGVPGGRRIGGSARTVDILPTLLGLLGLPVHEAAAGESLTPWLHGETPVFRQGFSEARFKPYRALASDSDVGPKLAARDDRFTAILRLRESRLEVYDRAADPGENVDLMAGAEANPALRAVGADLEERLRAIRTAVVAGEPVPDVFTPEIRLRLQSHGGTESVEDSP